MPSHSSLLGAAGAHHVMAELLRRGYVAALAPEGVPTVDILVTDVEGARLCSIQVKARRDELPPVFLDSDLSNRRQS
jgi:hypothetical protein